MTKSGKIIPFGVLFVLCLLGLCTAIPVAVSLLRPVFSIIGGNYRPAPHIMVEGIMIAEQTLSVAAIAVAFLSVLFQKPKGAVVLPLCSLVMRGWDLLRDCMKAQQLMGLGLMTYQTVICQVMLLAGTVALLLAVLRKKPKQSLLVAAVLYGIGLRFLISSAVTHADTLPILIDGLLLEPLYWMLAVQAVLLKGSACNTQS